MSARKEVLFNVDKVYDAYMGKMGDRMKVKTNERIGWIAQNVYGKTILDVGCSQGLVSILLAREGKKVVGIDVVAESVKFATTKLLKQEDAFTRANVTFKCINFLKFPEDKRFDTIIFGEVLEHLLYPEKFVKKAKKMLQKNGRLIITVPFGFNIFYDHKATYYVGAVLEMVLNDFALCEIKYFDGWVGLTLDNKKGEQLDWISIVKTLEAEVMRHELVLLENNQQLLDENRDLSRQIADLNQELVRNHRSIIRRVVARLKRGMK